MLLMSKHFHFLLRRWLKTACFQQVTTFTFFYDDGPCSHELNKSFTLYNED